jgi:hypothetical protein
VLANLLLVADHVCLACISQVMVFGGLDGILTSFAIVSVRAVRCTHVYIAPQYHARLLNNTRAQVCTTHRHTFLLITLS